MQVGMLRRNSFLVIKTVWLSLPKMQDSKETTFRNSKFILMVKLGISASNFANKFSIRNQYTLMLLSMSLPAAKP